MPWYAHATPADATATAAEVPADATREGGATAPLTADEYDKGFHRELQLAWRAPKKTQSRPGPKSRNNEDLSLPLTAAAGQKALKAGVRATCNAEIQGGRARGWRAYRARAGLWPAAGRAHSARRGRQPIGAAAGGPSSGTLGSFVWDAPASSPTVGFITRINDHSENAPRAFIGDAKLIYTIPFGRFPQRSGGLCT